MAGFDIFSVEDQLQFSNPDLTHTSCPSCLQTLQAFRAGSRSLAPDEMVDKEVRSCLLVVDDDPSVAALLVETLREWVSTVLVARNGREGLDVVERHRVDGLLVDMQMPIMDGRTIKNRKPLRAGEEQEDKAPSANGDVQLRIAERAYEQYQRRGGIMVRISTIGFSLSKRYWPKIHGRT